MKLKTIILSEKNKSQKITFSIFYDINRKKIVKIIEEYANRCNSVSNNPILKLNGEVSGVHFSIKLNNKYCVSFLFYIFIIT